MGWYRGDCLAHAHGAAVVSVHLAYRDVHSVQVVPELLADVRDARQRLVLQVVAVAPLHIRPQAQAIVG